MAEVDPADEQRTSAVFQPFPSALLKRLSPPHPEPATQNFPRLFHVPSESDVSERRYSDLSALSLLDQEPYSQQDPPHHADDSSDPLAQVERLRQWDAQALAAAHLRVESLSGWPPSCDPPLTTNTSSGPGSAPASAPAIVPASAPAIVPAPAPASAPASTTPSVSASALTFTPALAPAPAPAPAPVSAPGPSLAAPPAAPAIAPRLVRTSSTMRPTARAPPPAGLAPLSAFTAEDTVASAPPSPADEDAEGPVFHSTPTVALGRGGTGGRASSPGRATDGATAPKHRLSRAVRRLLGGRTRRRGEREARREAARVSLPSAAAEALSRESQQRDWRAESLRVLRLRGERAENALRHSVPVAPSREAVAARGHGRRPRSCTRASCTSLTHAEGGSEGLLGGMVGGRAVFGESASLCNIGHVGGQRERERGSGLVDGKREASSFAGYRGRLLFTTEGSSVSSSEDREDDGSGLHSPESGHLYLSKRQLRAMQYRSEWSKAD